MKNVLLLLCVTLSAALSTGAKAQDQAAPYAKSRAIIEDLVRISLTVRGQDRDNPMILFVPGGPGTSGYWTRWATRHPRAR